MPIQPAALQSLRPDVSSLARAMLVGVLLLAGGTLATAQAPCFEPGVSVLGGVARGKISADIDGDGDLDLAFVDADALHLSRNLGSATFTPRVLVYTSPTGGALDSVVAADFDADLDIDLVVFRRWNPGGGGITAGIADLLRNDGTGAFTAVPGTPAFTDPGAALGADFDGDADPDLLVLNWGTVHILRNDGTGAFTLVDSSQAALGFCLGIAAGDFDGDLDVDLVWRSSSGGLFTLQNDGSNHFSILASSTAGIPLQLADLDGDGDCDLVTRSAAPPSVFSVSLNNGSGAFGPETLIPGFSPPSLLPAEVAAHDLDADLDLDLVLTSTAAPRLTVLQNFGNATFAVLTDIATDTSSALRGPVVADMDSDGDVDVLVSEEGPVWGVRHYRACRTAGEPLCPGDGSGTACPCGNNSAASAQAGCLNSLGSAGTLRGAGSARLANDTLVLSGSGMPNSTALYFQGDAIVAPIVLDDGIMCVGGTVIRLGTKLNVANASQYPVAGDQPISVRGAIPATAGVTRAYQCFYRNAASFCTSATSNRTNAVRVTWFP